MTVESLGEALERGWQVSARCALGRKPGFKTIRECHTRYELDLSTLVWTRGARFPLARVESRLKCPNCGSRQITLMFSVPGDRTRRPVLGA